MKKNLVYAIMAVTSIAATLSLPFVFAPVQEVMAQGQGPIDAPGVEYFLGPSLGQRWFRSNGISGGINSQVGTTYTIACSDQGKTIMFNNAGAIAVTLPGPSAVFPNCFGPNFQFGVFDIGAGTATVTPQAGTINGAGSKAFATGTGGVIESDGTNYWSHF